MKLIKNDGRNNHRLHICKLIATSEKIIISSGWMKTNGLELLDESLQKALNNKAKITIYSDFENTKEGVTKLLEKYESIEHIMTKKGKTIHSKIYYFEKGDKFTALIGSANITYGGLVSSDELSVLVSGLIGSDDQIEIQKYLNDLSDKYQK